MEKKETYLYVLLLPHMDKEYNLSYKIKFGFAENFEQRLKAGYEAYYGENGCQVLHVYKGYFTQKEDEFAIKQYLKEYLLFGDEWFKCCQEVLGFFNTYNTSEKLKQKISEIPVTKKSTERAYHKVNFMLLDYITQTYYGDLNTSEIRDKQEDLKRILREYSKKNQYNYLKEIYGFNLDSYHKYVESKLEGATQKACEMAIEFNSVRDTSKKLRMLVELESLEGVTKRDVSSFLELIPPKFKEYYTIIGPDFIKQFSCNEAEIKKEWVKKMSNKAIDISSEVYKIFEVGKRYSKSGAKDSLKVLYSKLGYKKTAKATDLEEYFVLKGVKFDDGSGKFVHGFELLEKK